MIITKATEEEMQMPKLDRRRENKGRAALVDIAAWKPGEKLDISGSENTGARRSVMNQARKRGWIIRELSPGVFIRMPRWDVYLDGNLSKAGIGASSAEEAIWLWAGKATKGFTALLQE